ncbi:MAG: GAF domain-containing protein [Gemmatimonadota bacterium]|nr:GAF domain-containing protein [Gemmatimonadota bacterium]
MAEVTLDLRGLPKREAYEQLAGNVDAVLEGIQDDVAEMATVSSLVHHAFGFLWTGFYRVVTPGVLLRVGPYQGTLGCLEIAFGRGVCGVAAREQRPIIVRDVNEFADHIACDARSQSEIVLPVTNKAGELIAVFDVDSEQVGTFDEADERGLTAILARFARQENRKAPSPTTAITSVSEMP